MKIESVHFTASAFLVETPGARFEYVPGSLKIYQGLGKDIDSKRLVLTLTSDSLGRFDKVQSDDDHALFWSKNLNIGIYGDSTCILAPRVKMSIKCKGNFKPDYEGRRKGELLLIDDSGGVEIYPQRYEAGYQVKKIELGKKDWLAEYLLNANERVMIAAFPGRHFDWERSFKSNMVFTRGDVTDYGKMPTDSALRRYSQIFDIILVWWRGLYKEPDPSGPYIIANDREFRRFLKTAHENDMKIVLYCSFFYYYRKFHNIDPFFEQLNRLREEYSIDGVYIDGLLFDYQRDKIDNKLANWEMVRRLRQLFGSDGVIIYHGTSLGSPVATVPNIDVYCDATLNGEQVRFQTVNDPYVQYQVRKYGISNTIGMWKLGPHPASITDRGIIDAILAMNGRERVWSRLFDDPLRNESIHSSEYQYYRKRLEELKKSCFKSMFPHE